MDLKEFLNSKMCREKITELQARQTAILNEVEQRKQSFESVSLEEKEKLTTEIEERNKEFETNKNDIVALENHAQALEKAEQRFSLLGQLSPTQIEERKGKTTMDLKEMLNSQEYRAAWQRYILSKDETEIRSLVTTTDNIPVPTYLSERIETAWENYGNLLALTTQFEVAGNLTVPYEKSADDAAFHDEGAEVNEENITFGKIDIVPGEIIKWVSFSNNLAALTPESFMDYIANELAYRVFKTANEAVVNGTKNVKGIVGSELTVKLADKNLDFNIGNELASELVSNDVILLMNKKTFLNNVMGLKDTAGRPIYSVVADNAGKARYFLNGIPVEFTTGLKPYDECVATTDVYMIAADMKGYTSNMPNGKEFATIYDPYTLATKGVKRLIGNFIVGGDVTRQKAFASVKKAS